LVALFINKRGERAFLREKYPYLDEVQMAELTTRLSHVLVGEMVPYYVMRYGTRGTPPNRHRLHFRPEIIFPIS